MEAVSPKGGHLVGFDEGIHGDALPVGASLKLKSKQVLCWSGRRGDLSLRVNTLYHGY